MNDNLTSLLKSIKVLAVCRSKAEALLGASLMGGSAVEVNGKKMVLASADAHKLRTAGLDLKYITR